MILAQEAREISKANDLTYVYSLIIQAAHRGEYIAKCDAISNENIDVLGKQGYKVEIVEIGGARMSHRYFRISWRDTE